MFISKSSVVAGLTSLTLLLGTPAAVTLAAPPDQIAGQANVGNVISALNNIAVQIENLEALNELTVKDVQVVNIEVEDVFNDNNIRALNNALYRNSVEVITLRNVLNNNVVIVDALNDVNVDVEDVIAIDVLSGGDVIVYVQ